MMDRKLALSIALGLLLGGIMHYNNYNACLSYKRLAHIESIDESEILTIELDVLFKNGTEVFVVANTSDENVCLYYDYNDDTIPDVKQCSSYVDEKSYDTQFYPWDIEEVIYTIFLKNNTKISVENYRLDDRCANLKITYSEGFEL